MQKSSRTSTLSPTLSRFPTIGEFCKAYSADCLPAVALVPERAVLSSDSPALSELKRDYGVNGSVSWLFRLLSGWQEQMPVAGKMPVMQLHFLSETISRKYYYLKASEVMLFLARLMGGEYKVGWYGHLNPDTIITALEERFLPEREGIIYKQEMSRKDKPTKGITWEEYCRRNNINRKNPLEDADRKLGEGTGDSGDAPCAEEGPGVSQQG